MPPTDPESNFKPANELLFAPLKIPENEIHRIRGEDSPEAAVEFAEDEFRRIMPVNENPAGLDLIFLGMGEDGHVASLFPNTPSKIEDISSRFWPSAIRASRRGQKVSP